jgi:RNA polymerase sigma factor (sigma-70 family)
MQSERITVDAAFVAYAAPLYRYIFSKVGQAALAEDLTSIVFLKAIRWLQPGRSSESIRGWLYATARTAIADHWRSHGALILLPLDDLADEITTGPDRDESVATRRIRAQVHTLLGRLPERERTVLTLHYLRGYTAAEIGRLLGLSTEYVRVVQFRALRQAARMEEKERNETMEQGETSYTERMQQVLTFAREEARAFNHYYLGTEHLLLGLLREEGSSAVSILGGMRVTPERVRGGLLIFIGRGKEPLDVELRLTPRAITALALGKEEAQRLGSAAMEPEHLLLGLLREGEGVAAVLLELLEVRLEMARAALQPGTDPFAAWPCAFCGKGRDAVRHLVQGPGWVSRSPDGAWKQPLLICNECVDRSRAIIAEAEAK